MICFVFLLICRSLLHDIDQLAEVDGYSTWREKEANDLSNLVQDRFHFLQNPKDCKSAKKLVCSLNKVPTPLYKPSLLFLVNFCVGLWLRLSAASCCILFYGCLWNKADADS